MLFGVGNLDQMLVISKNIFYAGAGEHTYAFIHNNAYNMIDRAISYVSRWTC